MLPPGDWPARRGKRTRHAAATEKELSTKHRMAKHLEAALRSTTKTTMPHHPHAGPLFELVQSRKESNHFGPVQSDNLLVSACSLRNNGGLERDRKSARERERRREGEARGAAGDRRD